MSLTSDKISLINRNIYSFDSIIVPLTFLITQPPKVTLNEGFEFRNPNVKGECGCGESFTV